MSEIVFSGLRAATPLGFLAALGAFRHASQMGDVLGDVRLGWTKRGSDWFAFLVTGNAVDSDGLLRSLVDRVCALGARAEFSWADQVKKNSPEYFQNVVKSQPSLVDWFAAFGSELALSNDGTLRSTDFDMTGGQQKFLLKLREASAALASSPGQAEALLREALFGPWLYKQSRKAADVESSHSMGLDPSTLLQGAFTSEEPAGIKDKRGIRGAIWLAFEALPFFPCAFSEGRLRTAGFFREKKEDRRVKTYFEWGVWEQPLTVATIKALLLQSRDEWIPERGVSARFRSERVNLNKDYYSLAPAELVVE